ncbi:creatininase family protein [Chloroflexota bacterium]
MKIKIYDMTWEEVGEVLKKPHCLLVPVGSVEQHSTHLPLSVDTRCAEHIADQVAIKINGEGRIITIVAPTLQYTDHATFQKYPGNVGISVDTLIKVITEITHSFVSQGFKNILYVNGHFPNGTSIAIALGAVAGEYPEAGLYAVSWWDLGFEVIPGIRKTTNCLHAEELETSVSLVIQPENVHMEKAVKDTVRFSVPEKYETPDFYGPKKMLFHSRMTFPVYGKNPGSMGDPTAASRETGDKVIQAVVNDLAEIIREVVKA